MSTVTDESLPDTSPVPVFDEVDHQQLDALRQALVARRKRLGMTEPDIAKRLGTPLGRLRSFEAGHNTKVNASVLQRYARAVGGRLRFSLELADRETESDVEPT